MSSVVTCHGCQRQYKVDSNLAGKRAKCKCGAVIGFPASVHISTAADPAAEKSKKTGGTGREDAGPFAELSNDFTINYEPWAGTVLASPTAVYFLKSYRKLGKKAAGLASMGGAVGGLIATAASMAISTEGGIATCTVADLPEPVKSELDPKQRNAALAVVVIPKSTIALFQMKGKGGTIEIHAGNDRFGTATGMFSSTSVRDTLNEFGWNLNTPLTPSAPPCHDARSADLHTKEPPKPPTPPISTKVAVGFVAAAFIILIVVMFTKKY